LSSEREAALRCVFDAVNRGDAEAALSPFDPGVEWHTDRADPDGGVFRGHDGVRRFMRGWFEPFDDLTFEVEELVHGDAAVLVLNYYTGRGTRSGVEVEDRVYELFTFRGGSIVRVEEFYGRDEAFLALRASNETSEHG
jgi:ketosteroid isomerase-like protein